MRPPNWYSRPFKGPWAKFLPFVGDTTVSTGAITGSCDFGQSQTFDANALLQFIGQSTFGQSQTFDAAAVLAFTGTANFGQSQTFDANALLQFIGTAEFGQGQTFDAGASVEINIKHRGFTVNVGRLLR